MKLMKFVVMFSIFFVAASTARSQCCCSGVYFNFLDKNNKTIPVEKLKIKDITINPTEHPISLAYAPNVWFDMHCGTATEVLAVTYKGNEMRLHFRVHGDFGHADGTFKFQKGDFIVEPVPNSKGSTGAFRIDIRKAKKKDLRS